MKKMFSLIILCTWGLYALPQQHTGFPLSDVIRQAQLQSPKAKLIQTTREISYYQYLSYKSELNPQISFYGNAPVFDKRYYAVRQPDGAIKFQSIFQHNSQLGFSLSQQLPFSGGELSLHTDLTRFDDFKNSTRQYNSTPVYLRLNQPLFGFNALKWQRKIEPLKLEESKREYVQEMEHIAQQCVNYYFDVLDAKSDMHIAQVNLQHTEANYTIEQKRVNLGTTTEDKLLQLELQVLKSKQDLEKATYDYQVAELHLKTFIGWKGNDNLNLLIPEHIPVISVDITDAIRYAKANRVEFIAFERKKLEAEKNVAAAKAATKQVSLVASYGLNNAATALPDVYNNMKNQQQFSIGFNIPVVDWGRRKARLSTARAIEKLTITNNEFDEATLYQEITTLVKNIGLLKLNIALAQKTDSVAQRRFTIANTLYQVGKLSVTDLNLALSEKDNARRTYIGVLRQYWNAWYQLRMLTLFDFERNTSLADVP